MQNNDVHQAINDFAERNGRWVNGLTVNLYHNVEERPYPIFIESVNKYFDKHNDAPSSIQLEEDNENVIKGGHCILKRMS